MGKYIDAEKLKAEIDKLHDAPVPKHDQQCDFSDGYSWGLNDIENLIDSLQQEQPKKYIELNGIKYREVSAKTNDKICKDCDYFLDNGTCELVDCPCIDDNTILERLNEQPEVDLEKYIENEINHHGLSLYEASYGTFSASQIDRIIRDAFELGKNSK